MRKFGKLLGFILAGSMLLGMGLSVHAEEDIIGKKQYVEFDGTKMISDFKNDVFDNNVAPGDTVRLEITLKNTAPKPADWYMWNGLRSALAAGYESTNGAFEYEVTYDGTVLFTNDRLVDVTIPSATSALKNDMNDYIYLGRLDVGEVKVMTLTVVIDGETQGNAYQNSLSHLELQYAATMDEPTTTTVTETPTEGSTTQQSSGEKKVIRQTVDLGKRLIPRGDAVKTGDEFNIQLFSMLFAGSGILLLILAVISFYKDRRKESK